MDAIQKSGSTILFNEHGASSLKFIYGIYEYTGFGPRFKSTLSGEATCVRVVIGDSFTGTSHIEFKSGEHRDYSNSANDMRNSVYVQHAQDKRSNILAPGIDKISTIIDKIRPNCSNVDWRIGRTTDGRVCAMIETHDDIVLKVELPSGPDKIPTQWLAHSSRKGTTPRVSDFLIVSAQNDEGEPIIGDNGQPLSISGRAWDVESRISELMSNAAEAQNEVDNT